MEFVVNEYIALKLENNKTIMYVNGEECDLCCGVLVNVAGDYPRLSGGNQDSVDFVIDSGKYKSTSNVEIRKKVTPEEEFWAFCSNLQVWVENDYNTDLLHYDASIPLLDKLVQAGDPLAKEAFKREILRRLRYGTYLAVSFLKFEGYLNRANLTSEEIIEGALNPTEAEALIAIAKRTDLKYVMGIEFDDDEIRERPLYRNLLEPELFYTVDNGHVYGLEIELTKELPNVPEELKAFERLKVLHIWVTDSNITIPLPSFEVKSVTWVKLIMHESVRFPSNLKLFFPELKNHSVYVGAQSVKPIRRGK